MRADYCTDLPVEVPPKCDLFTGRFSVHVNKNLVGSAVEEVLDGTIGGLEGGVRRIKEEVPREVYDAKLHAFLLDHAVAMAGLRAQVVGRPQNRLALVEVREDLGAAVGVVAERDHVNANFEEFVGDFRRDSKAAGDVLAVDDDEGWVVALADRW